MTPEQAKTKWCPFVRVQGYSSGCAVNRPTIDPSSLLKSSLCIADKCMMWSGYDCGLSNAEQEDSHNTNNISSQSNKMKGCRECFGSGGKKITLANFAEEQEKFLLINMVKQIIKTVENCWMCDYSEFKMVNADHITCKKTQQQFSMIRSGPIHNSCPLQDYAPANKIDEV